MRGLAAAKARIAKLELALAAAKKRASSRTNGNGGSGDKERGAYCTPKSWADRAGPWDVDPFSNPRSHIVSTRSCQLERGDNGLEAGPPGTYRVGGRVFRATENTRVWIQPPYEIVLEVLAHYGHTRFGALLRFDPSTEWFVDGIYPRCGLICVPRRVRIEFEPPPEVKAPGEKQSKNPYPHAFYFARAEDATPAILRACISWVPGKRRVPVIAKGLIP